MYSADELKITGVHSYLGGMQIAVLARTSDDFPAIREGIAKQVERVNAGLGNKQIDIMEQPDNIVAHVNHVWANVGPDLTMLLSSICRSFIYHFVGTVTQFVWLE